MHATWTTWAPVPLRLALGIGFIHHGWHNIIMHDERAAFLWMLKDIGVARPTIVLWIISGVSFLGGIALVVGAFVRSVSVPLMFNVPAVLFFIHAQSGFDYVHLAAMTVRGPQYGMPGYEVSVLYAAGLLALMLLGSGSLSVDARRARRAAARAPG